jgi:hypothetical protein
MGEGRNVYRVFVGRPEGNKPLRRPRCRWENGIKMDLSKIGWGLWSGFTWLRIGTIGGSCECGDEPSDYGATELISWFLFDLK